ncbi:MAG: GNAT family N-acetyltransferase [Bacteroidetes bacterium]|nr:GNAT family N-acetyltransferase [Bacteroidota bacterium]MBU1421928.1 GNAT family N-acetyltransferase [Bacteroidota bacterium]MBU2471318.1 GNAT family N-acetyltransferase [Bacteroidota bacterium]
MIIRKLHKDDREQIHRLIIETAVFSDEEVNIAMELIDIFINNPNQKDYDLYSAIENGEVLGYICIGPTPITDGSYDLYWIVVKVLSHGKGVGKKLIQFAENSVMKNNGRLLVAETSSQEKYRNTREFYLRIGYSELAKINDYYKVGDDLIIYGKYLYTEKTGPNSIFNNNFGGQ